MLSPTSKTTRIVAAFFLPIALLACATASAAQAHVGVFAGAGSLLAEGASVRHPRGLAIAADGSVFIVDRNNHRVLKVSADGSSHTIFAGDPAQGWGDPDARDARATGLSNPEAVAIGADGSVFIADTVNHRVLKISADGSSVTVFAGDPAQGWGSPDAKDARATPLNNPEGLAIGADGSVFIADTQNNRVVSVSADGSSVTVYVGDPAQGWGDPDYDDARVTQLNSPSGLAVADDGSLFVVDTNNHRVLKVSIAADWVTEFAGDPEEGWGDPDANDARATQLYHPTGIAIAADGSVFIVDTDHGRVLKVSADGSWAVVFAGDNGRGPRLGKDALTTQLSWPFALAIATDGSVFIADTFNDRVLFVGAEDEYQRLLNEVIEAGVTAAKKGRITGVNSLETVVYNLKIMATGNTRPPAGNLEKLAQSRRYETVRERLRLGGRLGRDMVLPVLGHFDSRPDQAMFRFRAKVALEMLKGQIEQLRRTPGYQKLLIPAAENVAGALNDARNSNN